MPYRTTYHISCVDMKRIYRKLIKHSKEHLIPLNKTNLPTLYPSTIPIENLIVLYLIRNNILFINECPDKTGSTDTKIGGRGFNKRKVPWTKYPILMTITREESIWAENKEQHRNKHKIKTNIMVRLHR
jgi:hypothetical protein